MLSIDGLVSGLDTTVIVEGLLQIQQRQIDQLTSQRDGVVTEQAAFAGVEARLLSLQTQISTLVRVQDSVFDAKLATSSDETTVAAAASDSALPGVYNVRVTGLARSHQIASQGYADPSSTITEGTLDIRLGSGPTTTIAIDSSNNTLQGLADAINVSSAEVTASIINDGTSGSGYRLLLTGDKTGAANAIAITNNLGASGGGAVQPDFSNTVEDAADASLTLGSGPGAITIVNDTNQIEDVIPGVTLDLLSADSGKDITITVSNDTESAKAAIEDFVGAFNDLMEYVDDQVRFDSETEFAGTLLGNRSVIRIQDDVRRAVTEVVANVNGEMNRLSALGITFTDTAKLIVNESQLDDVLSGNVEGVTLDDVRRLFTLDGVSDNSNVQFVLGGTDTKESTTPYEVDIIAAAERASITATNSLAASIVIDNTNNTFGITVDGQQSDTLTLTDGTYTRAELAAHVEAVINADPQLLSRSVSVALQSDSLQITSDAYGSNSQITIGTGTALTDLGFDGSETDVGLNVAGKFIVDGVEETATGSGRLLVGDADNENTAGLQLRVTLTPSQVQLGTDANLTVTRGLASRLDQVLSSLLEADTGRVATVNDGFQDDVESIETSIERLNSRFEASQESLIQQFAALESALAEFQTTSSFLTSQLASLNNLTLG